MHNLKIAFFGTPYVARDTLEVLCDNGLSPTLVVSNPDAPRGRRQTVTPSETKEWAQDHNLTTFTPTTLSEDAIEEIRQYDCDCAIVVAYGKIFPEKLIGAFPKGVLNIHYSLLPKYRGASPVEAALLSGDTETGVTIQLMAKELDAGDIVAQEKTEIREDETTVELRRRLIDIGARLLVEVLPKYIAGEITPMPQNHEEATHVGKIQKEEGCLSLDANAETNWRKYRAYAEWPGTFYFEERNGKNIRVKITDAAFEDEQFVIKKVIPEGRKEMCYEEWQKNLKSA